MLNQKNETNTVERGDIVQLRSGGPHMTVTSVATNRVIGCLWFDENNRICRDGFSADFLFIVDKPSLRYKARDQSDVSCGGVV
ncbi:YodC family protein [Candidatus Pacearchaeota archaeon]|nr:YodC family protein [Candidatus Pacearchaeota archaeon]